VVPPQRAVWLPPGVRHRLVTSDATKMRTLYIRVDAARRMPRRCAVLAVTPLLRELIQRATELPLHYNRKGPAGRIMQLLLDEIASLAELPYNLPMPRDNPLARICARLVETPNDRATLAELGRAQGTTARTLERHFRARTGMTFSEWRRRARLLRALDWISQGKPILAVALDLGYESPSAFSAMFKREFGSPPTHYRASAHVKSPV
jgi:AraC-like DNA-binding protein